MTKFAIIGSLTFKNYEILKKELDEYTDIEEIIIGDKQLIYDIAKKYADENSIPCKVFPLNYKKYGREALVHRNIAMVEYCDKLIAFFNEISKDTLNTIRLIQKSGKELNIVNI